MLDILRQNSQSWLIKALFAIIILAFVITFGYSFNDQKAGAIAYVNEIPVSRQEYLKSYKMTLDQLRSQAPNLDEEFIKQMGLKRQVLSQLADSILLNQEAAKLGINPSDVEIQQAIVAIRAFQKDGKFDQEQYRKVLQANGLTPGMFEADMRQHQKVNTLRQYVGASAVVTEEEAKGMFDFATEKCTVRYAMFHGKDFESSISPTPEEIKKFYDENSDRFVIPEAVDAEYIIFSPEALADPSKVSDEDIVAYYDLNKSAYEQDEQVKGRHILVKVDKDADKADVAKARKRIDAIRKKIAKPADFAKVAEAESEGPSASRGGELGWFGRGMMVPEFEEVAFTLEPGKVSEPVRSPFGWHLILVEGKKEKGIAPLDDVRDDIRLRLAEDKAAENMADLLDEATARLNLDEPLAKVAKELNLELHTTGLVNRSQAQTLDGLGDESINAIFALPAGGVTETPVTTPDGFMLAAKIKDKPSSVQPLENVKETIVTELKRQGGLKLALQKAGEILAQLKDPATKDKAMKAVEGKLKVTEAFNRDAYVNGIGQNKAFSQAAFTTPEAQWLPEAYEAPTGAFIAQTELIERAPVSDWEKQKKAWIDTLMERKRDQLFQAYMTSLRESAKIEIADKTFFE